ncbi:hypothetical protein AQUCO_00900186v1 [Aquilegia coerulea]|uniref:Lipoxygenase n=1 Tax=Aquilegia coerulea TaxID=218851 RepID=A0A2G5ECD3_AQUCA|nr:hypothetical protein AQUCO_00900186v1 [Aquilegia coerulea]
MLSSSQVHQFEFSSALLALRSSSCSSHNGKKSIAATRSRPTVWKIKSSATPTPSAETISINPRSIIENYKGGVGVGVLVGVPVKLKVTVTVKAPAGQSLELEFVSSQAHDGSDEGITVPGTATKTLGLWESLEDDTVQYVCELNLPAGFGEVGAVRVLEINHDKGIFVENIVLTSDGSTTAMACNSWVQPSNDEIRVFFPNKSYLPSDTPSGIKKFRKQDLESLRGEGPNEDEQGQRKASDRIYAYDKYNDLGNPAEVEMVRPVLGGPRHPYPRRCRTGRPRVNIDGEDHEMNTKEDYYVPRDDVFSPLKSADFEDKQILSAIQGLIPKLMAGGNSNLPFPNFSKIDNLVSFNVPLNTRSIEAQGIDIDTIKKLLHVIKLLFETEGPHFQFRAPELLLRDRFSWLRDEEFARQTLAGLNPLSIELVKEWPIKSKLDPSTYGPAESAITNDIVERQINGVMTVDEAIKNKKLFIIDYHDILLPNVQAVRELEGTTLYGSRALFFLTENNTLMPIAIELTRPIIDNEPQWRHVFTPSSDATNLWLWRLAKVHVLAHDSGYHQLVSHWVRTHCWMEPYAIAANRQLSVMHPIYKLLHPHFRYTMAINANAQQTLINAGGVIESCFSPKRYSMQLSSAAYDQLWCFDMEALPADLIRRGMAVEDPTAEHGVKLTIEDYPYAKDGLELWDAIKIWVSNYVKIYYQDENAIATDTELQAWWTEVRTKGHEDKKDEPWWPVLNTKESLIETLTTIIWVASGHHAAVNFGQYGYASYFPNRPTIARTNVPLEDFSDTEIANLMRKPEDELMKCYPSQVQAITVLVVLNMLPNHSPDEEYIGDQLPPMWTGNNAVEGKFKMFKGRLSIMNGSIEDRNNDPMLRNRTGAGVVPYKLLEQLSGPGVTGKGVPNSVSI